MPFKAVANAIVIVLIEDSLRWRLTVFFTNNWGIRPKQQGDIMETVRCPNCDGRGEEETEERKIIHCNDCDGNGYVTEEEAKKIWASFEE